MILVSKRTLQCIRLSKGQYTSNFSLARLSRSTKIENGLFFIMPSSIRSASFSGSYESGSGDNDFDDVNLPSGATAPISNGKTIYQRTIPYSDQKQTGKGKANQKRPTHFVCFPLVTDQSVPQLVESLKHFRDVTTAPTLARASVRNGVGHDRKTPDRDAPDESAEMTQAVHSVVANGNGDTTENLKVT
jgi:hypothetical protein